MKDVKSKKKCLFIFFQLMFELNYQETRVFYVNNEPIITLMILGIPIIFVYRCLHLAKRTMSHKVFVYGTLKRNEPNHYWLTDPKNGTGKFVGEGTTKSKYPLIIATRYNIPFLLYSPGSGSIVKGEVYEVDETMLSKLDILEDHPNYYIREIDDIVVKKSSTNECETLKCWVYFLKTFKPDLLCRPHLDDYSSKGAHGLPYMESCNESTIDDLDDVLQK